MRPSIDQHENEDQYQFKGDDLMQDKPIDFDTFVFNESEINDYSDEDEPQMKVDNREGNFVNWQDMSGDD